LLVKIEPLRVQFFNESQFPGPTPFLDVFFAGNSIDRVVVTFEPDQAIDSLLPLKSVNDLVLVFVNAANEVVRYAEAQRFVPPAG
jgi:hypothetical protein